MPPLLAISTSSGAGVHCSPKLRPEALHDLDGLRDAELVGVPHRAAVVGREAVAVDEDDVLVAGAQRDALFEQVGADVGQGEEQALHDLLVGDLARRDAQALGLLGEERFDLGRALRLAVALVVVVEAGAGLLAPALLLVHGVDHGRLAAQRVRALLLDVVEHVDAREIEGRERAHRHAGGLDDRVDAGRRDALGRQRDRLARVVEEHPVADEAERVARHDRRSCAASCRARCRS